MCNYPGALSSFTASEKCEIDNRIKALALALHWAEQAVDINVIHNLIQWVYPIAAKPATFKPIEYNKLGYCTACGKILPVPEIRCGCPACGTTGGRLYKPLYSAISASGLISLLGQEALNFYISNAVYWRVSWGSQSS